MTGSRAAVRRSRAGSVLVAVLLAASSSVAAPEEGGETEPAAIAWGLEPAVRALEEDRGSRGAGVLSPSEQLHREARRWAEAVADGLEPPALEEILGRLAAEGHAQRRLAVATIRSSVAEPPAAETWRSAGGSWENLLNPELRSLGGARVATHDGGRVWVLMAGQAQADAVRPALEELGDLEAVRRDVLERVNRIRRSEGLRPLKSNVLLERAAQNYAELMAETGHYGHVGPEGRALDHRLAREGYRYRAAGENLARGVESVEAVVEGWLESPEHRRNILDERFRETGLGVAWGPAEEGVRIVWVQVFGRSQ